MYSSHYDYILESPALVIWEEEIGPLLDTRTNAADLAAKVIPGKTVWGLPKAIENQNMEIIAAAKRKGEQALWLKMV